MWFWFFIVSACLNLLAIFYVRWLIKVISTINQDVENVSNLVGEFAIHTKSVYELEMFYGDETLMSLIDHTKFVAESIRTVEGFYSFLGPWEPIEYDTDQE